MSEKIHRKSGKAFQIVKNVTKPRLPKVQLIEDRSGVVYC